MSKLKHMLKRFNNSFKSNKIRYFSGVFGIIGLTLIAIILISGIARSKIYFSIFTITALVFVFLSAGLFIADQIRSICKSLKKK